MNYRRPNPYVNVFLAPPEPITANFSPPQMNLQPAPMRDDSGEQMAGLGRSLVGLRKRFAGQGDAIKGALMGGTGGKA
jgi:hypothetical protein